MPCQRCRKIFYELRTNMIHCDIIRHNTGSIMVIKMPVSPSYNGHLPSALSVPGYAYALHCMQQSCSSSAAATDERCHRASISGLPTSELRGTTSISPIWSLMEHNGPIHQIVSTPYSHCAVGGIYLA